MHRILPGTQVGEGRVEAWQGQGAYGAVYRAVRVGQEHAGPVALKLALYPWDARFAREAELLSRLSHPSIPQLLDRGVLRHPSGTVEYPFFVMEWVDGTPLYIWAEQHSLSSGQVCQVLAQMARALEVIHAAGAAHRDVKGDNVLVRLSDRRPVLIDFGSGHFQGAKRLTWQSLAPGTPEYLSPQACLFDIRLARNRDSYYPPSPADDLFALGVTAYRLVMGQYPPAMDAQEDESGTWHVSSPDPRLLLENNPRVEPLLREVILRLLSDAPEARGTAAQTAEALEAVAKENCAESNPTASTGAEAAPTSAAVPIRTRTQSAHPSSLARERTWKPWPALAVAGVSALLLWVILQPVPIPPEHVSTSTAQTSSFQAPDAGTAAVGDASPTEPQAAAPDPSKQKPTAEGSHSKPRPRPLQQTQPNKQGRCPGLKHVVFDGGCWVPQPSTTAEECTQSGYVLHRGKCYAPVLEPPRKSVPTSSPAEAR